MSASLGPEGTLAALLLCGHVLGDFVFQTGGMVVKKSNGLWLLAHAGVVLAAQTLLLIPFLSRTALIFLFLIGIGHALVDKLKVIVEQKQGPKLVSFLWDQMLHLAVLVSVWTLWPRPLHYLPGLDTWMPTITTGAAISAAYAFNWNGGAAIVGLLLRQYELPGRELQEQDTGTQLAMGRTIGVLERMIILTLTLMDQWGAVGLVLAAKSIARFKDLEQRSFSEYYLVGTLTSVLVAIGSGLAVKLLVVG